MLNLFLLGEERCPDAVEADVKELRDGEAVGLVEGHVLVVHIGTEHGGVVAVDADADPLVVVFSDGVVFDVLADSCPDGLGMSTIFAKWLHRATGSRPENGSLDNMKMSS